MSAHVVDEKQAMLLHLCISALMRKFRIEPGLLAGSVYAGLHANDIGLFEILAAGEDCTIRRIAQAMSAPMTTVSSALDRLERQGIVVRRRTDEDRRLVRIELTAKGRRLSHRLRNAHLGNCRAMLVRLRADERDEFLRLATQVSGP